MPDSAGVAHEGPALHYRTARTPLALPKAPELLPFGRLAPVRLSAEWLAAAAADSARRAAERRLGSMWVDVVHASQLAWWRRRALLAVEPIEPEPAAPPGAAEAGGDLLAQYTDLGLEFRARFEAKTERNRNERCLESDFLNPLANCRGHIQPLFDFQFGVRSGGSIADRVTVNVDYDSQREFEASNNVGVRYEGRSHEVLQLVELGNVTFALPPSRFITSGIPSGNYGIQAAGQLGPMQFRTIYAEQKGNVVRDRVFHVGERTERLVDREIEDWQMERRRFFWVVDPAIAFASRYPNVDILDPSLGSRVELPLDQRPQRVLVYRYRPPSATGISVRDINGPVAHVRQARNPNDIGPFEVLQQGVDYYIDPSNLWIALVTPIGRNERLAVSYTVLAPDGREIVRSDIGGTFPLTRRAAGRDTVNLLWDGELLPGDPAFNREIRSVYRIGGDNVRRESVSLRVAVGSGGEQERPLGGRVESYLQLFGLAQPSSPSSFDIENRLWPRTGDPNVALNAGGTAALLLRDHFVVFPSLRPFAADGLARPPDPVNDSLYRTADEDLASQRRPPTRYRMRVRYATDGGTGNGALMLGSVQLRPGSERLLLDGVELRRGADYSIDYDLGRVSFSRPDTLFSRERQVTVQYEENPLFVPAPTAIFGLSTVFPFEYGQVGLIALSQSQKSTFNRAPLGFEPVASTVAGINANLSFPSTGLTRALNRLPFVESSAASTINVQGEVATSRPHAEDGGLAYLETFETEGGIAIPLLEGLWRTGSQPAISGGGPPSNGGAFSFELDSAATIAWQNIGTVLDPVTRTLRYTQLYAEQIDSQFVFTGGQNFRSPETVLWQTLYPADVGGQLRPGGALWRLPRTSGRRWRSISHALSPGGTDLSRVEQLEFWALVDTTLVGRLRNPTVVADVGDISENTVAFAPTTMTISSRTITDEHGTRQVADTVYTGRRLVGYDRLDSERDPITRSFDASRDDRGLPGDVVDTLVRVDLDAGRVDTLFNAPLCNRALQSVYPLGDAAANCTRGNRRLDEQDLDLDGFLNRASQDRNGERIRRFVIDMANPSNFDRVGRCYRAVHDTTTVRSGPRPVCWVRFRVPFNAPAEELNDPLIRRAKSMRLSLISTPHTPDTAFTTVALARLRLVGSPWVKRTDRPAAGVAGSMEGTSGYVIATVIGTQDRNPAGGLFYESPPGVTDEADSKQTGFSPGLVQVNERSLRLMAGDLGLHHRAEAFYRFPEGEKNFMGYRELRVWARGRGKGWGDDGDLQFFVKVGRDDENFYLYRTGAREGSTRDAWLPEVRVDFARFIALRARLQAAYLESGRRIDCTGSDSLLVVASLVPASSGGLPYAACADGYIAFSANPGINPPNLAAVQEMSVGILRVDTLGRGGGGLILPSDTLELWVNDIRLGGMVHEAGYAGHVGVSLIASDLGTIQVSASRRDGHFRQLGELPSYVDDEQLGVSAALRLDRFLPRGLGLLLPFSVSHVRSGSDPTFLSRSDLGAAGIPGLRTPRANATSYSLSARRATPVADPVLGTLLNNLSLSTTYSTADARSEYHTGRSSAFAGTLDFNLIPQGRQAGLPRWFVRMLDALPAFVRETEGVRSLRSSQLRLNPAQFRLTTGYARTTDRRAAFALPIASVEDTGFTVQGLNSIWRNTATLELRPTSSLGARVDVSSSRDMRDYGDSTTLGRVAQLERGELWGVDLGLERERRIATSFTATPALTSWLRPRFEYLTSFSMLRDPNFLRVVEDTTGELRLPRRFLNSQGLGAGATLDIGRALELISGGDPRLVALARALRPVDVAWRQDLRSTFDGVAFDAPLRYQLGRGGTRDFRLLEGTLATAAGASRSVTITHAIALPLGITLTDRYTRATTTSWARVVNDQTRLDAEQVTFPDVSLRWSLRTTDPRAWVSTLGGQVGARVTHGSTFQPTLADGTVPGPVGVRYELRVRQYPLSGTIIWNVAGGVTTTASWSLTDRRELRSGGIILGEQEDLAGEIGKAIPLPASWELRGQSLRTRLGFQQSHNRTIFDISGLQRRVTDSGRWALNANADSDISETLSFTMTLARIINYDHTNDRRFSQTVVSIVMHLSFFAGEIR